MDRNITLQTDEPSCDGPTAIWRISQPSRDGLFYNRERLNICTYSWGPRLMLCVNKYGVIQSRVCYVSFDHNTWSASRHSSQSVIYGPSRDGPHSPDGGYFKCHVAPDFLSCIVCFFSLKNPVAFSCELNSCSNFTKSVSNSFSYCFQQSSFFQISYDDCWKLVVVTFS